MEMIMMGLRREITEIVWAPTSCTYPLFHLYLPTLLVALPTSFYLTELYTTSTMPAVIDHVAFPHILDLVFANLDVPGLLRFRQTCIHFRDKVDAQLFRHIALCRTAPSGQGIEARQAVGPFARLPFLPGSMNLRAPGLRYWHEAKQTQKGKTDYIAVASAYRQLALTIVVDYFGARVNQAAYPAALANIRVLRRPKALNTPLTAPTVIDYRNVTSRSGIAVCGTPIVCVGVQPGCSRLVVNLSYDAGNTELNDTANKFDLPRSVKEIELVYRPQEGTAGVHLDPIFGPEMGLVGGELIPVLNWAVPNGAKVTFVGVEKMLEWWLNGEDELEGEALVQRVRDHYVEIVSETAEHEAIEMTTEQVMSSFVFKTLEEWDATAPALERLPPRYDAPFCIDESLLVPGSMTGQYYEEWKGRAVYERDPGQYWRGVHLDNAAIHALDPEAEDGGDVPYGVYEGHSSGPYNLYPHGYLDDDENYFYSDDDDDDFIDDYDLDLDDDDGEEGQPLDYRLMASLVHWHLHGHPEAGSTGGSAEPGGPADKGPAEPEEGRESAV